MSRAILGCLLAMAAGALEGCRKGDNSPRAWGAGASGPAAAQDPARAPSGPASPAARAKRVGLVYGEVYLKHQAPQGFPERPERLQAVLDRLKETGLLEGLVLLPPRRAEEAWLTAIHEEAYLRRLQAACAALVVEPREANGLPRMDTPDAPLSPGSYEAGLFAAGGVLAALDAVVEGNVRAAFCAVRPPGHHALKDRAMGFCLINSVAVAARYAQKKHALGRVLIVDWDVHHGNGTQAAFYEDPSVLYFSVHRSPFYPGTGSADEKGRGQGEGFTINVPLPAGSGDAEYKRALEESLVPAAERFKPDIVLVSAGFDAHADDPLGGMKVTARGYADLTRVVLGIAARHCGGRLVSVLEGGYDPSALAACVEAHLRAMME